jgi:hypothetical protein
MNIPNTGNCAKCGETLTTIRGGHILIQIGTMQRPGIAYACWHCNSVVSVEMDPLAVKTEIVAEITNLMRL